MPHRRVLRRLWREGGMSRLELSRRIALRPNDAGRLAGALLAMGVLREGPAKPSTGGRPRVPLEIDPERRHVLGLAVEPGMVAARRVSLLGEPAGEPCELPANDAAQVVAATRRHLRRLADDQTLLIGMSVTGFVDPDARKILLSSALPDSPAVSLAPVYQAAGPLPVLLENDMHALAARWVMTRGAAAAEDVVLALLGDGRVGAAMLIGGRPNRGCAIGANELGHVRFFADTERCYCGHKGCLERICSSRFLRGLDRRNRAGLIARARRMDASDRALRVVLDHLGMGLANVVNFVRPSRLVLAGPLSACAEFRAALAESMRGSLLPLLADRVIVEAWDPPLAADPAETAAWLALASLYCEEWNGHALPAAPASAD
ncbi:MAG TPA: ROK family protein [Phycisphaerae bacterium]|nr:ROK family protein [Phycisphaerae bacterium]